MSSEAIPVVVAHIRSRAHACPKDTSCRVPLSPHAIDKLRVEYEELVRANDPSTIDTPFELWLHNWSDARRGSSRTQPGLDDGRVSAKTSVPPGDLHMIDRPPPNVLGGTIHNIVLLVDFPDQPHDPKHTKQHFDDLLFGATNKGSMTSYYRDISGRAVNPNKGIELSGQVEGWYTMPRSSAFYTGGQHGIGTYPNNAQKLAEDAIDAALKAGVVFAQSLDVYSENLVAGLIVIHAGAAAEETVDPDDIWSHKHVIDPKHVAANLNVSTYLTLSEECHVGVCAHEYGHLVCRWADYYDTDPIAKSSGLGNYCLMASGSWGNKGLNPVYPNGMLRMFHNWVDVSVVRKSGTYTLQPVSERGSILIIRNKTRMNEDQYILVEYRRQTGRDTYLPDQGIAIYVVDENIPNVNDEHHLAIELLQADGNRDLANVRRANRGDDNDLFPIVGNDTVGKDTLPDTMLPNSRFSGVTIKVNGKKGDKTIDLHITLE